MRSPKPNRPYGFSLVEVLIALLVIAIGLLGLASLQARGLKFNHDAYVRSQATNMTYDIVERMRARRSPRHEDWGWDDATMPPDPALELFTAAPPDPATDPCNPTDSAVGNELRCWNDALRAALPQGAGIVNPGTIATNAADPNYYDITITWFDRESAANKQVTLTVWP